LQKEVCLSSTVDILPLLHTNLQQCHAFGVGARAGALAVSAGERQQQASAAGIGGLQRRASGHRQASSSSGQAGAAGIDGISGRAAVVGDGSERAAALGEHRRVAVGIGGERAAELGGHRRVRQASSSSGRRWWASSSGNQWSASEQGRQREEAASAVPDVGEQHQ
jgi:hypothetical protein